MTGDQKDILGRLKGGLPPWFGDDAPNLTTLLTAPANLYATAYALYLFVVAQSRLGNSTGPFLDLASLDFFGNTLPRNPNESDASFLARILAHLFKPKGTRAAIISTIEQITGYTPVVYEPWRSADTGGYGANCGAGYGAGGAYGSQAYPYQGWVTVYRDTGVLGGNAGYGTPAGAYGANSPMHYQSAVELSADDQAILAAIDAVKAAGTIVWVSLQAPPPQRAVLIDRTNGYILIDETNSFELTE